MYCKINKLTNNFQPAFTKHFRTLFYQIHINIRPPEDYFSFDISEAHLEPSQTSKIALFAKKCNS